MLVQREAERDLYLHSNNGDSKYSKTMLEKQSSELVTMRQRVEEFERRDTVVDKKWTELIKENELNRQQADVFKDQLEKQRETYNKLLAVTEQRVIKANLVISQGFGSDNDYDKKKAAEFLSQ